jgi:hypothetical protein
MPNTESAKNKITRFVTKTGSFLTRCGGSILVGLFAGMILTTAFPRVLRFCESQIAPLFGLSFFTAVLSASVVLVVVYVICVLTIPSPTLKKGAPCPICAAPLAHDVLKKDENSRNHYLDSIKTLVTAAGIAIAILAAVVKENSTVDQTLVRRAAFGLCVAIVASVAGMFAMSHAYDRAGENPAGKRATIINAIVVGVALVGFLVGFAHLTKIAYEGYQTSQQQCCSSVTIHQEAVYGLARSQKPKAIPAHVHAPPIVSPAIPCAAPLPVAPVDSKP